MTKPAHTLIIGGKIEVLIFDDLTGKARLMKHPEAREILLRIEKPLSEAEPVFRPMSDNPVDWLICHTLTKRKKQLRQLCLFEKETSNV